MKNGNLINLTGIYRNGFAFRYPRPIDESLTISDSDQERVKALKAHFRLVAQLDNLIQLLFNALKLVAPSVINTSSQVEREPKPVIPIDRVLSLKPAIAFG